MAGLTVGEAAEKVGEKILKKKIGDDAAEVISATLGKIAGDVTEVMVDEHTSEEDIIDESVTDELLVQPIQCTLWEC